jgi:hypothetical protein
MLGHLVYGRNAYGDWGTPHARRQASWIVRLIKALLRRL